MVIPHAAGGTARLEGDPGARVRVAGADDLRTVTLDVDGGAELVGLLTGEVYTFTVGDAVAYATFAPPPGPVCPQVDTLAHDPGRLPDSWLLIPHRPLGQPTSCTLVLDQQLRPRWWLVLEGTSVEDAVVGSDGDVWLRTSEDEVVHATLQGEELARWSAEPGAGERPLPLGPAGHELVPLDDGSFWAFGQRTRRFEVPVEVGGDETREAAVDDTPVQLVAPDGALLREVDVLAAMQPGRCGYECLVQYPYGLDFLHGNAFVPLPDGRVLVSVRNQDVVVMFDAEGRAGWRMGDPLGWDPPWSDAFLTPVGEVTWPYHHHGLDYDPETGDLLVFDNHTWGGTPWRPGDDDVARVAWYRVDEAAGTVRQVGAWRRTATGELRAPIMGDADLPAEDGGPILAVFSWVRDEGGVTNRSRGWGDLTSRVVAFDPGDEAHPPLDLRLRTARDAWPDGGYAYRVEWIAPLAP